MKYSGHSRESSSFFARNVTHVGSRSHLLPQAASEQGNWGRDVTSRGRTATCQLGQGAQSPQLAQLFWVPRSSSSPPCGCQKRIREHSPSSESSGCPHTDWGQQELPLLQWKEPTGAGYLLCWGVGQAHHPVCLPTHTPLPASASVLKKKVRREATLLTIDVMQSFLSNTHCCDFPAMMNFNLELRAK